MRLPGVLSLALLGCLAFGQLPGSATFQLADTRIQFLSKSLVRVEQRGPQGFEDRPTFMVKNRDWRGAGYSFFTGTHNSFPVGDVNIEMSNLGQFESIRIDGVAGFPKGFWPSHDAAPPQFFPAPGTKWKAFVVADDPRIVPAPWGATPSPARARTELNETSGWDTRNQAKDFYVFVNRGGGYKQFIKDYLKLTGRIEMPPLYALGLMDSRYHPYSQQQALDVIDKYRAKGFPLDVFVVDTDWRVGASKGYGINTKLWPDMATFLAEAHKRQVRVMFNDHPEPQTLNALDPAEMKYRWDGLTSLLALGADVWWYDRNWITRLREPAPGLKPEIWGQRLFHDITAKFRPGTRPLIMSNVQGIDNGVRNGPPQPGFHRYPIYWTGDTKAQWSFLRAGISHAVDAGVDSLLPYMSEDLGGHIGKPTPELYIRFLQYGCLSPIARIHCTAGESRFPWDFGAEAEEVTREYVKLRYRLLPVIYSAARRAYEEGTPILRRCDLEWPEHEAAKDSQQYMLGDDILVAPISESKDGSAVDIPPSMLRTKDGGKGLRAEYFGNTKLEGQPVVTRIDPQVNFEWGQGAPDVKLGSDNFSVRWTGKLGPVPETGEYVIGTRTDDGAKLYLDGNIVVSKWSPQDNVANIKLIKLEKGKSYDLEFDYFEQTGDALAHLVWIVPSQRSDQVRRRLWLPPGSWTDAWTHQPLKGPSQITIGVPVWKTPMFVRDGAILTLCDGVRSTADGIWRNPKLECYVPEHSMKTSRTMYEDDTRSLAYADDAFAKTTVTMERRGNYLKLRIAPPSGTYGGMPRERQWTIRFILPEGSVGRKVNIDGRLALPRLPTSEPESIYPFNASRGISVPVSGIGHGHVVEMTLVKP
ncbi:MAG: DUF5110 domain-containing protein [Armatimonadetes bacterium]|nr:DUF5110 domain-containing protein [Armatimonadota bacterium]